MSDPALLEIDADVDYVSPPPEPAMKTDEAFYERVDGRRVEVPAMSAYGVRIASRLATELNIHVRPLGLGEAVTEGLFRLPLAEDATRTRRPDVAFVSAERWPLDRPMDRRGNAWDVVPDLAVEVLSPTDKAEDILAKVGEYFRAGVRLVWVVSPGAGLVLVFDGPARVRMVAGADTLDGGDVLPEFRLPPASLFDRPAAP